MLGVEDKNRGGRRARYGRGTRPRGLIPSSRAAVQPHSVQQPAVAITVVENHSHVFDHQISLQSPGHWPDVRADSGGRDRRPLPYPTPLCVQVW